MNQCETKWQRKWIGLEITHPSVQEVATAAEAFCGRWFNNDRKNSLLVLVGDTGTCKTHVAEKIFKFCSAATTKAFDGGKFGRSSKPSAMMIPWPLTVSKFSDRAIANRIVEDALSATLRVIDDIGAEKDSWGDAPDRLCQILSRSDEKFTVITTNIEPKDWATKFDNRISDRLLRNSVIKSLKGVPSYAVWQRTNPKK